MANRRQKGFVEVVEPALQAPISRRRALQLAVLAKAQLTTGGFAYDAWHSRIKEGVLTEAELDWVRTNLDVEVELASHANLIDTETEIRTKLDEIKALLEEAGETSARISIQGSFIHIDESGRNNGNWYSSSYC